MWEQELEFSFMDRKDSRMCCFRETGAMAAMLVGQDRTGKCGEAGKQHNMKYTRTRVWWESPNSDRNLLLPDRLPHEALSPFQSVWKQIVQHQQRERERERERMQPAFHSVMLMLSARSSSSPSSSS